MGQTERAGTMAAGEWFPVEPWRLMYVAAAATVLALLASLFADYGIALALLLPALLLAAGAVALRPSSALLVAASGAVTLVARWSLSPAGDSVRMVLLVLAGVAFFAAALLSLPEFLARAFVFFQGEGLPVNRLEQLCQRGREWGRALNRAIISLLVVVHFLTIASAIMAVPPPGRQQSWLAQVWWSYLQPYLQFFYLTNAYRFYSPEPGPPSLLWFYIEYSDGSARWVYMPNREDHSIDPLGQEYYRRLSLGESVSRSVPLLQPPDMNRRLRAGDPATNAQLATLNTQLGKDESIPTHPDLLPVLQYRLPQESCIRLLSEYAGFVATHYPSEKDPNASVLGVKVYRVEHRALEPDEMADPQASPTAPWTYRPYYQGEYTTEGKLKDPDDPFLFWLIPIYQQGRVPGAGSTTPTSRELLRRHGFTLRNCLEIHAKLKTTTKEKRVTEPAGQK